MAAMLSPQMGLIYLFLFALVLLWLLGAAGLVYALGHPKRKTFAVALGKGDPTDPADLGLTAQEVVFTLSDQSRSPGWVIQGENSGGESSGGERSRGGSSGGDSSGPTIVIVHGFGDSRYGALQRVPMVLPYVRRAVVFDLPGQGESQARRGYGGLREPRDVLAVLGQLEESDARRVVLLGASMGAGIAIAAAAAAAAEDPLHKTRIVGVIAEGPYRCWDEPLHNFFRNHRYPRRPIIPLAWLWLRLTAKGFKDFDRAGHAARLSCPLLVIHGSEDRICPITSARKIADAAPDGAFVEVEGGGHDNLHCEHEAAYRDAVGGFLKRLCSDDRSGKMEGLAQKAPRTRDGSTG